MAKYNLWSQANGTKTEWDTLMEARGYAISKLKLNRKGKYGIKDDNYSLYLNGKSIEMIQARNDSRSNFICIVRGKGGNKSYIQILNAKGETVSPKLSVYSHEIGWERGLPKLYKY